MSIQNVIIQVLSRGISPQRWRKYKKLLLSINCMKTQQKYLTSYATFIAGFFYARAFYCCSSWYFSFRFSDEQKWNLEIALVDAMRRNTSIESYTDFYGSNGFLIANKSTSIRLQSVYKCHLENTFQDCKMFYWGSTQLRDVLTLFCYRCCVKAQLDR